MGRTKDYIIRMRENGIDVLHPEHILDERYYEKYEKHYTQTKRISKKEYKRGQKNKQT
jgi:hypothetical protein